MKIFDCFHYAIQRRNAKEIVPCKVKHISPATYFFGGFHGFGFKTICKVDKEVVFALIDSNKWFGSILWLSTRTSLVLKADP